MLPGRTDNAVKNRHALLHRKRVGQRHTSGALVRKRVKAEPAAALTCGHFEVYFPIGGHKLSHYGFVLHNRFQLGCVISPSKQRSKSVQISSFLATLASLQEELRHLQQYNYVQPSQFYAGMTSSPVGAELANLQLLSAYNMQHLRPSVQHVHPSVQHIHPALQPTLFQSSAQIKPELAASLCSQYSSHQGSVYGYPGHVSSADSFYGVLGLLGNQTSQAQPVALGVAIGQNTTVGSDSGTPNSTGTVTGHPSFFHQTSTLPSDSQGPQEVEPAPRRTCSEPGQESTEPGKFPTLQKQ